MTLASCHKELGHLAREALVVRVHTLPCALHAILGELRLGSIEAHTHSCAASHEKLCMCASALFRMLCTQAPVLD